MARNGQTLAFHPMGAISIEYQGHDADGQTNDQVVPADFQGAWLLRQYRAIDDRRKLDLDICDS